MKIRFYLLISILIWASVSWAQDTVSVNLSSKRSVAIQNAFFIEKIVDKRGGYATADITPVDVVPSLEDAFADFYNRSIPRLNDAKGITLFISHLGIVNQGTSQVIGLRVDFIYENQFVFEAKADEELSSDPESDLATLAVKVIEQFDKSEEAAMLFQVRKPDEELRKVRETSNASDYELSTGAEEIEDRNVSAIGYQIGGLTLIGFDYEFRVSDVFGPHIGAGLSGYTFGLKIHTGDQKDSPFFNLSFKDGGFGLVNTVAMEYGGRITGSRNKGGFGFHYQVGLGYITNIDPDFQEQLFGDQDPPPVLLSLGLGVSW